jgi:short-subunit dehydrogenase
MIDVKKYGPWALVAGGSEGVGAAFARELGKAGFNIVLIARKEASLEEVARGVRTESGVQVRTLVLDLTRPDMLDRVIDATSDIDVGLLAYNAGASHRTALFLEGTIEDAMKMIQLNPIGQAFLSYHFGKKMVERGRGGIILIGSMAGVAGAATVIAYSGAKAFTQVFAEGLWAELQPKGVDVLCVVLGATDTPAMSRLGIKFGPGDAADPTAMAQESLDNIANGPVYVPARELAAFERSYSLPRRQAAEEMSAILLRAIS